MVRVFSIVHLCLVFTLMCWVGSYPFMGEMMAYRKQAFLFQTVMGSGDLVGRTYAHDSAALERLKRNQERFSNLPVEERERLVLAHDALQAGREQTSFFDRLTKSFSILLFELPPFERAWIFFSLIVAVMLLIGSPGAPYAAWLLPFIVVAAALDNQSHVVNVNASKEEALFPTEEYLVARYASAPLSGNIFQQQNQLKDAWQQYLIAEWVNEVPSKEGDARSLQLERGEYAFNLERLNCALLDVPSCGFFYRETSLFIWMVYLIWNSLFAWVSFIPAGIFLRLRGSLRGRAG